MAPPPKKPIKGVQGVGAGVRNQTAMRVQVSAYQRAFRPRGKGRDWEDRTEKSKAVTMKRLNSQQPSQNRDDLAAARMRYAMR